MDFSKFCIHLKHKNPFDKKALAFLSLTCYNSSINGKSMRV